MSRRRRQWRGEDSGLSLVEVMVAMALLSIMALGLLYGTLAAQRLSGDGRARVVAANLAAEAVANAREQARVNIDSIDTRPFTETIGGREYTVTRRAVWQPRSGRSPCESGAGSEFALLHVSVGVTWTSMGGTRPVESDTLIAPRVGSFDPSRGSLAVKVLTADGVPNRAVQVRVSGPASRLLTTDEQGCAFFSQLPDGNTYAVSVAKAAHVDSLGEATPTRTDLAVVRGTTSAVQFDYDTAGRLGVGAADPGYPIPPGTPLALGNTNRASGPILLTPPAWPTTVESLYPFPAGYGVWLGSCSDANPQGVDPGTNRPWWAGAQPAPVGAVTQTGVPGVQVKGAQVEVRVQRLLLGLIPGGPASGVEVRATHRPQTGGGCAAGETITLGRTGTDGVVRATLPFGTSWTIRTATGDQRTVTLDPSGRYPLTIGPMG